MARNQEYFAYLKSLFQKHEIKKTYLALVWGRVAPGRGVVEKPIGIKAGTVKRTSFSNKMAKDAVTEYRVIRYLRPQDALTLLEVIPKTGRTHQIRVHLASIGHPIVGDALYGRKSDVRGPKSEIRRLMLHALSLEFTTQEGRRIKLETEPPSAFKAAISG